MDQDYGEKLKRLRRSMNVNGAKARQADIALVLQNMDVLDHPPLQECFSLRQKAVAEAKLSLLKEVEKLRQKDEGFLSAACRFEKMIKTGCLSEHVMETVRLANIRSRPGEKAFIAGRTLYRWNMDYNGLFENLIPADSWNNDLPEWVRPMFELFHDMENPNIKGAVSELRRRGFSAEIKRAKQYIRQVADRVRTER